MIKAITQKLDKHAICIMICLGAFFYFLPGQWISIEDDSIAYLEKGGEGVLPGYPIFLSFFRRVLGERYFLNGVVVTQSILAIICTLLFVIMLRNQFKLRGWECILLYAACMLPFSIYLPESGITHQILTEGITYSIFYLFFMAIIKAVWMVDYKWYLMSMLTAFLLGIIRSQMIFLQAICLLILLWITLKKNIGRMWHKIGICLVTLVVGMVLSLGTYRAIYAFAAFDFTQPKLKADVVNADGNEGVEEQEKNSDGSENSISGRSSNSQFVTIIMSRGFYEAEQNDADLFQDKMMRGIFMRTYELADSEGKLYNHAPSGLYMWREIVYDRMKGYALQAIAEYDSLYPGERARDTNSIVLELGLRVLFKHFNRYVYHTIRLMMPSFIATVFFQIEPIYLLCHFITLFLYIYAMAGCVVVYRNKQNRKSVEFMATVLGVLIIMVVSVNVLFIGLQRYVVYGMGIFYCALYLISKEILIILLQKRQMKESNY